ncbi:hypothetical protein DICPUDRAFT_36556 [Dictyostelium purpureum]|uniref:C2 domain-containing protein n=1 Tax=Dictyostelium purpureum TaxID=5786 RepID=F0ZR75_DICPU|nr:uncharacterized protein DICPUDRAFT_36556 [Dictyostelium purpureum]EGC33536.1 hypothetical protein DICPUDRAFT_36556 [Dictyostelium purpureum]|eukprot:XP_003289918.1 hypothetical protein DICPUDRAFT_36556 [Dictyostelium purpureum]
MSASVESIPTGPAPTTTTTTTATSSPSSEIKDKFIFGNLEVKVKEVKGCQLHFLNVKCELAQKKTEVKTKPLTNHTFFDVFSFRVTGQTSELEIEAWKKNFLFKDKMTGQLNIPINDLLNADGEAKWYPLTSKKARSSRIKKTSSEAPSTTTPDDNAQEKGVDEHHSAEDSPAEEAPASPSGRARSLSLPAKKVKAPPEICLEIKFVLNEPPKEVLKGIILDGQWNSENNFGSLINNPHWIKCTQYLLTVKNEVTPVTLKLRQPQGVDQRVSFFVINYDSFYNGSKKVVLDTTNDIKKVDNFICPIAATQVDCSIDLEPGQYCIIPYAETFAFTGSYKFNLDSEKLDNCEFFVLPKNEDAQWTEITVDGLWTTATNGGGDINILGWTKNPQYAFTLTKKARACVLLSQDDNEKSVGFYVIKQLDSGKRAIEFREQVGKTESFKFVCSTGCTMTLEEGTYIVIPSTYDHGVEGAFHLTLFTDDKQASFAPLTEGFAEVEQVKGTWVGKSAGGSPNQPTFFNNPQFHLKVPDSDKDQVLAIQLIQDSTIADEGIGFIVLSRDSHAEPLTAVDFQNEMVFSKTGNWEKRNDIVCRVTIKPDSPREFTIIPSTFDPNVNRSFKLQIYSDVAISLDEIEAKEESSDSEGSNLKKKKKKKKKKL